MTSAIVPVAIAVVSRRGSSSPGSAVCTAIVSAIPGITAIASVSRIAVVAGVSWRPGVSPSCSVPTIAIGAIVPGLGHGWSIGESESNDFSNPKLELGWTGNGNTGCQYQQGASFRCHHPGSPMGRNRARVPSVGFIGPTNMKQRSRRQLVSGAIKIPDASMAQNKLELFRGDCALLKV